MANSILTKFINCRITIPCSFVGVIQPARTTIAKHYNPKFKRLRAAKTMKIPLPDYNEDIESMSREKVRQKMKERGVLPPRPWMERSFHISSTGGIFEAYVPPEGDGKASLVSSARAKQAAQLLEKKSKSMLAIRKIKSFDEDFDTTVFARQAQKIYEDVHTYIANKDKNGLHQNATERAYPELRHNTYDKTIHWKLLSELEPPRVVHARCTDVVSKENIFGQVTVRIHTQQQLAVYDRFGRLMHGSEIIAKDVLEYVVFEKHLSDTYGNWRLHDKIVPEWLPPREPAYVTKVFDDSIIDVGISTEKKKAKDEPETEQPQIADK